MPLPRLGVLYRLGLKFLKVLRKVLHVGSRFAECYGYCCEPLLREDYGCGFDGNMTVACEAKLGAVEEFRVSLAGRIITADWKLLPLLAV